MKLHSSILRRFVIVTFVVGVLSVTLFANPSHSLRQFFIAADNQMDAVTEDVNSASPVEKSESNRKFLAEITNSSGGPCDGVTCGACSIPTPWYDDRTQTTTCVCQPDSLCSSSSSSSGPDCNVYDPESPTGLSYGCNCGDLLPDGTRTKVGCDSCKSCGVDYANRTELMSMAACNETPFDGGAVPCSPSNDCIGPDGKMTAGCCNSGVDINGDEIIDTDVCGAVDNCEMVDGKAVCKPPSDSCWNIGLKENAATCCKDPNNPVVGDTNRKVCCMQAELDGVNNVGCCANPKPGSQKPWMPGECEDPPTDPTCVIDGPAFGPSPRPDCNLDPQNPQCLLARACCNSYYSQQGGVDDPRKTACCEMIPTSRACLFSDPICHSPPKTVGPDGKCQCNLAGPNGEPGGECQFDSDCCWAQQDPNRPAPPQRTVYGASCKGFKGYCAPPKDPTCKEQGASCTVGITTCCNGGQYSCRKGWSRDPKTGEWKQDEEAKCMDGGKPTWDPKGNQDPKTYSCKKNSDCASGNCQVDIDVDENGNMYETWGGCVFQPGGGGGMIAGGGEGQIVGGGGGGGFGWPGFGGGFGFFFGGGFGGMFGGGGNGVNVVFPPPPAPPAANNGGANPWNNGGGGNNANIGGNNANNGGNNGNNGNNGCVGPTCNCTPCSIVCGPNPVIIDDPCNGCVCGGSGSAGSSVGGSAGSSASVGSSGSFGSSGSTGSAASSYASVPPAACLPPPPNCSNGAYCCALGNGTYDWQCAVTFGQSPCAGPPTSSSGGSSSSGMCATNLCPPLMISQCNQQFLACVNNCPSVTPNPCFQECYQQQQQCLCSCGSGTCYTNLTTQCDDTNDNDYDGLTDASDPGCWINPNNSATYSTALNHENRNTSQCQDGLDNDGDGTLDQYDPGCWTNPLDPSTYLATLNTESASTPACEDGFDNDGDGAADQFDPGCLSPIDVSEGPVGPADCSDSYDNDNDGLIDAADPECLVLGNGYENQLKPQCTDGIDNDSDTLTDYGIFGPGDPGCASAIDLVEDEYPSYWPETQCTDGIDNDGDGLFDTGHPITHAAADPGCDEQNPQFDNTENSDHSPRGIVYETQPMCTSIDGWICDPDDWNAGVPIQVYANAPAGLGGVLIGGYNPPNFSADPPVQLFCGGTYNHGFSFPIPAQYQYTGTSTTMYVYGVNIGNQGNNYLLDVVQVGCPIRAYECYDNMDNDGDGVVDWPHPSTDCTPVAGTELTTFHDPTSIAIDTNGLMWVAKPNASLVSSITANGVVTDYAVTAPTGIAIGADGRPWFGLWNLGQIGTINANGQLLTYSIPQPGGGFFGSVSDVALGSDGKIWYVSSNLNRIGVMTSTGVVIDYGTLTIPTGRIAKGPDGNMWFGLAPGINNTCSIGRAKPDGTITYFDMPAPCSTVYDLAAGPDGNMWFTTLANSVGKITMAGNITVYDAGPESITTSIEAGPDGNMWFTNPTYNGPTPLNKIGRINVATGNVQHFTLPATQRLVDVARGTNRNLWFTVPSEGKVISFTFSCTSLPGTGDAGCASPNDDDERNACPLGGSSSSMVSSTASSASSLASVSSAGSSAASVGSSAASVASSAASVASSTASVASSTASVASSAGSSASYAPPAGNDFFVYDIRVMNQVNLLGSVNTQGGVQDIAVNKDGNVMVASPRPDRAMMIVDVSTPSAPAVSLMMSAAPNPGNAAATLEKLNLLGLGVSGAPTPDGRLMLMQMQLATGQPPAVAGTANISTTHTVNRARIEPRGCYAFAALENGATQLTVKKIVDPANPTQVQNYADGIGTKGTSLQYDAWKDRLYLLSNQALNVLVPVTPGTGGCP